MAAFDNVIHKLYIDNFKGYMGNPPTNKDQYDTLDCWIDRSIAPSWEDIESYLHSEIVGQKREPEYPRIEEQLDMLWHAIDSGTLDKTSNFYQTLKAVKDKYPK